MMKNNKRILIDWEELNDYLKKVKEDKKVVEQVEVNYDYYNSDEGYRQILLNKTLGGKKVIEFNIKEHKMTSPMLDDGYFELTGKILCYPDICDYINHSDLKALKFLKYLSDWINSGSDLIFFESEEKLEILEYILSNYVMSEKKITINDILNEKGRSRYLKLK